jgi:hypothetical protein
MPRILPDYGLSVVSAVLTQRTICRQNEPMNFETPLFSVKASSRRILRAWRVAIRPGPG